MTPEELLKPRYKVIADYPGFTGKIGDIYSFEKHGHPLSESGWQKLYDPYPHLFEPLPWYAERKPEDMPEYVRPNMMGELSGYHGVYKAQWEVDDLILGETFEGYSDPDKFSPATHEEYELFIKNKL